MEIKKIWIEAEAWEPGNWNPTTDNTDVIVTGTDDSKWVASFFAYGSINALVEKNRRTGECLSGQYLWASDMILVDEVSRACIEKVVHHLARQEPLEFESIFTRIEEETARPKADEPDHPSA